MSSNLLHAVALSLRMTYPMTQLFKYLDFRNCWDPELNHSLVFGQSLNDHLNYRLFFVAGSCRYWERILI